MEACSTQCLASNNFFVSDIAWLACRVLLKMGQQFDQKNIRRRVYDALNVLMAMNIISKEKKEIRWIGLPTNTAQECQGLEVHTQLFNACHCGVSA